MKTIVAVDAHWGIGANNGLLYDLPLDMRHFVQHTKGKVVLMGYNTLLSFPNGAPLKGRTNIVLAPEGVEREDCVVVHSLPELWRAVAQYPEDMLYVIGGAMFYHTTLPYCHEAIVTKVEDVREDAQVFFDNLDRLPNWQLVEVGEPVVDNGYTIRFCTYRNNQPLARK